MALVVCVLVLLKPAYVLAFRYLNIRHPADELMEALDQEDHVAAGSTGQIHTCFMCHVGFRKVGTL